MRYTDGMKQRLIFLNGTMGVGKTTVCRLLQTKLPANVWLDGDNCWNMRPFVVNAATKAMVLSNIAATLNNFLAARQFDNILFCWVMHEPSIAADILRRLHGEYSLRFFTLVCAPNALRERLAGDVREGKRTPGIFARSADRAAGYANMPSDHIDTTDLSADQTASRIAQILLDEDFDCRTFDRLPDEARAVREQVFVQEQGFAQEFDQIDDCARHLVLYYRKERAGTCRVFEESGHFRIGRVAVLASLRGYGAGGRLLRAAEQTVRLAGGQSVLVDAQLRAQAFYERSGYTVCSAPFDEEGCPHVRMQKKL